jgi:choloylglycine hydrolase
MTKNSFPLSIAALCTLSFFGSPTQACTFITLTGEDGTVVASRTMEWGNFDLAPAITFLPAGTDLAAMTMPDGQDGAAWTTKYDIAGVTLLNQMVFGDGVNSEGLSISLLYLPGFAEYQEYQPEQAGTSIAPPDFVPYMLGQFASVAEVRDAVAQVRVVPVVTPELGMPAPVHFSVTDASGDQIIVEYVEGELNVHEDTLGVMTNSPPYDWHISNARNYINLRAVDWPSVEVAGIDMAPIGYGTGMLGLPVDFTPPSRFIRALAWTQTARDTDGGEDTVHEAMRILANFQLPMEATGDKPNPRELELLKYGGTQYTVSYDLKNLEIYFTTNDNPNIRQLSFREFDFRALSAAQVLPLRDPALPYSVNVTPIAGD